MRLDKLLTIFGYGTRKEVKELIKKKQVLVNNEIAKSSDMKVDEFNDEFIVCGNKEVYEEFIYLMLNKPDGYVSATYDPHDPTVIDLVPEYAHREVFPVGRLDKDTVGLLLITNDGLLSHELLSPKKHVDKKYYLKYEGKITQTKIKAFSDGITLDDGYLCMSATLIDLGSNEAYVIIKEGKFHQVKRMMEAIDCNVTYLQRVEFGSLKLDNSLEEGQYRRLTEEEINELRGEKNDRS